MEILRNILQTIVWFIISGLALALVYWLSGFAPGRRITRKRNRYHAYGTNGQIQGFLDGDKPKFLPDSMPIPFGKVFFELTYTQYVEDGKMEGYEIKSKDGQKIVFHNARVIKGIKKPIRTVTELVTRIRKTEIHPFVIEVVLPKSGMTFYLNFTVKIKIGDPMKLLTLDNFLSYVGNELNDAVFPWAVAQEAEWLSASTGLGDTADIVVEKMIGLKVDDPDCIMIIPEQKDVSGVVINPGVNLINYLNINKKMVESYSMTISEFSLDVGYDENVERILNVRNLQKAEEEKNKLQLKMNKTRETERSKELADENQERELAAKYLTEVIGPTTVALGTMQKEANGAWKEGTTVINSNGSNNTINDTLVGMLAKIARNTNPKTKGGAS